MMEYIEALKWPILIVVLAFMFRKALSSLLPNAEEIQVNKEGFKAKFFAGKTKSNPGPEQKLEIKESVALRAYLVESPDALFHDSGLSVPGARLRLPHRLRRYRASHPSGRIRTVAR